MRKTMIGALFISIAAILWGLDGVVLTPQLYNLDVGFVVFMLHVIPFLIMNVFLFREYRYLRKFSGDDFFNLLLIALFGGALGTLSIVKALFLVNFDHLSIVVLLQKLQPIFAILLAIIILNEKIKKRFILWASIAIIGSYFLAFGFHLPDFSTASTQAIMWSLVAAFSFGSATVFGKKALKKYKFYTVNFYRFGLTAMLMLLYLSIFGTFQFGVVTSLQWWIFLLIAFTTGSGAIFIYYYGLKKVRAAVATICELFFPVSAVIFDYLINGVLLTPVQWVSAIVMIFGIVKISTLKTS